MVQIMEWVGLAQEANGQWGCDTCGRVYWRLEDCPIVKVRKVGLIIGLRKKVYVNKCRDC